jgi:hypothetical protein
MGNAPRVNKNFRRARLGKGQFCGNVLMCDGNHATPI